MQKIQNLDYNTGMQGNSNIIKLLRVTSGLWLAYVGILAAIDYTLHSPGPDQRFLYLFDTATAVFLFGLTFWSGLQRFLGKAFLPLVIILISALPMFAHHILVRYLFYGPFPLPEQSLATIVPFLLLALLLVAWQYRWPYIIVFNLIIVAINLVIVAIYAPHRGGAVGNGVFAVLIQVAAVLIVGLFINIMVGWLRNQQRALEEANLKLTNYGRTLEDLAVTRERNRIAQELHDTLSHTLSGLSVQLETMKAYWDIDQVTARKRLDKSLAAVHAGLEETRRVLSALRAKPLEDLGLIAAIRQMAEEAATQAGISLDLVIATDIPSMSPNVEQCLFRVAQEAITNVIKHAAAKRLTVKLENIENMVTLTVQDDGTGFDIKTSASDKRLGLLGMKERVEFVKGNLDIISQPGAGTIVKLAI